MEDPRLRARHAGAKVAQARRKAFLRAQVERERDVASALRWAADRMRTVLLAAAGEDGKISPGRIKSVLDKVAAINREAYKRINSAFISLVRFAAGDGLKAASAKAQAVQAAAKGLQEAEPVDPLRQKLQITTTVFRKLFKGTLRQTMMAGLFGKTGVSNRVWDLRDENLARLKRLVGSGISAR